MFGRKQKQETGHQTGSMTAANKTDKSAKTTEEKTMKTETTENYAAAVEKELKEMEINFQADRRETETVYTMMSSADNAPGLNLHVVIGDNGDSKLRCYLVHDVPKARRLNVMEVLNRLNSRYRYLTLSIDEDGDVCAAYDFDLYGTAENGSNEVMAMIALFLRIADKCYPDIMPVIWKAPDDSGDDTLQHVNMHRFDAEGDNNE